VQSAPRRIDDPRPEFEVGDAQAFPVGSGTCDLVVFGLELSFAPRPEQMIADSREKLKQPAFCSGWLDSPGGEGLGNKRREIRPLESQNHTKLIVIASKT
jgi:hypothetical protein